MKVWWSLRSIPELSDLPHAQQRRLWRHCWPKVLDHWQIWLVFLTGVLGLIACTYLAEFLALGVGLGWPVALVLVSAAWGSAFSFVLNQVSIPLARPYLCEARGGEQARE